MYSPCRSRKLLTILMIAGLIATGALLPRPAFSKKPDQAYPPIFHPELTIRKATGEIKVDGFIEDAGWRGAAKIDRFFEHNPGDQTKPEVDTEVLITYDEKNLYVAWICYDDPDEIRSFMCERDNIFGGDYVILCIDTYGEASLAYEIAANPYGIPGDLLYSSNNGEDGSYDMIFQSEGRITESGYIIEMAIPFQGMRFPGTEQQVWRMDFWRNRPRESRFQYSWAAYDRDENCWPCQWGTVKGISDIKSGSGLEFLPSVVAYQTGELDDNNDFVNADPDGELSLGISYDISSELTAEMTINPDFSQIESDAAQIDVNSTFALYYPERRPFFQEGSDLFNTYFGAVYTRSINNPLLAGKLTMRQGSNSVGFLSAYDENSVIMLPFEEGSRNIENGKSYSNIVRIKHEFGEQSYLGLVATDRRFEGGGAGSLAGLDGKIRYSECNSSIFQVLVSHTEEVDDLGLIRRWDDDQEAMVPDTAFNEETFDDGKYTKGLDGESFWGHAFLANLQRSTSSYNLELFYLEKNNTFRADNGFEPNNNMRKTEASAFGIKRFEDNAILENTNGSLHLARVWNMDGVRKDEWINASWEVKFRKAQTGIHSRYMRSRELFQGVDFKDIWLAHTCLHTQPLGSLEFGGNIDYGHRIARHDLVMGKELRYGIWTELRPIDRLYLFGSFSYIKSDDLDTGERLFSQSVFRSRVSFQFSRNFSARVITQYNDRWDTWDIDPMLTYRVNSFSVFYLGSSHSYRDYILDEHGMDGWTLRDRQFFLKFQYLFQV